MISYTKLKEIWDDKGFEIVAGLTLAFLLLYFIYRKVTKQKGTWSKNYYNPYSTDFSLKHRVKKRRVPKESKGEIECRKVLESVFKMPFDKSRPDFLRNPVTGNNFNLELDCYNADLKLAVEYNGVQHYKYIPYFHKNKEGFLNQKYRDDMKRRICKENGIVLIEVPYTVNEENIRSYLLRELRKYGIEY